jgi:hypothetical protein
VDDGGTVETTSMRRPIYHAELQLGHDGTIIRATVTRLAGDLTEIGAIVATNGERPTLDEVTDLASKLAAADALDLIAGITRRRIRIEPHPHDEQTEQHIDTHAASAGQQPERPAPPPETAPDTPALQKADTATASRPPRARTRAASKTRQQD